MKSIEERLEKGLSAFDTTAISLCYYSLSAFDTTINITKFDGKLAIQKARDSDHDELLNTLNERYCDKYIGELIYVEGYSRSETKIDLLLTPCRVSKHVILMAIELNRNGLAKPLFFDEVEDNISYGSFNNLSSIDTFKTYLDFTDDQLRDLDKIFFDWLSPLSTRVRDTVPNKRLR